MRELKFRVWDKDTKEIFDLFGNYNSVWIASILRGEHPEIEVMQYTGLKDKNGKEIYERDIVKQKRCQCYDCEKLGEWRVFIIETYDYLAGNTKIARSEEIEIIGNIYENPELLESK